jgi:hypothetical protein
MNTVTITIDFTVEIPDHIDPDSLRFEIPIEDVRVDHCVDEDSIAPLPGARVTGYCTQEYFTDPQPVPGRSAYDAKTGKPTGGK